MLHTLARSASAAVRARGPLLVALALGALPAALAVAELGRLHPDEVYQSLEPAFYRVHGYGVLAWEWRAGLRNWAVPLLLAGLFRAAAFLRLQDPWTLRGLVGVPLALLHAAALLAAFRLGSRQSRFAGWVAMAGLGLLPMAWAYAGRTLSESLSATALVLAADALDRPATRARAGAGGVALGLAVVARYGSVPAVLGALLWLGLRRRWRQLLLAVAGGAAVAVLLGLLDFATWGAPFHSLLAWTRFNVLSGGAAKAFGVEPASFYLLLLPRLVPLWVWPALGYALLRPASGRPRVGVALAMAAVALGALLATPHKEERFLYPVVVLLVLEAGPALGRLLQGLPRAPALGLGALALASSLFALSTTVDARGDEFRALVRAARPPEVTGLLIVNEGLWGSGGFFYLGKRISWLTCDWPEDRAFRQAMADAHFNRAITFEGRALPALQAAGFRVTEMVGRETVLAR
ncbi:MAG: mannosyltransferase [Myxococcaceae bacterium]